MAVAIEGAPEGSPFFITHRRCDCDVGIEKNRKIDFASGLVHSAAEGFPIRSTFDNYIVAPEEFRGLAVCY